MSENVILVDVNDMQVGVAEKLDAHRKGLLHRAVSVFVFNSKNQLLIQKRASEKYHSPLLWTNTACTHPRPGETANDAAIRRLKEEMGIEINTVKKLFDFIYKETLDNELTEHEFDHVFIGFSDEIPQPDPNEVCDFIYVDQDTLLEDVQKNPEKYTVWFLKIIESVINHKQSFEQSN